MKVRQEIINIYNVEFSQLIFKLKNMKEEDRKSLYEKHSKKLFPRSKMIVNLDDLLSNRQDYKDKFKICFFVIGNYLFNINHYGEYNQEWFMKKTGLNSQRYPQKVILSLSMMDYIKKMRCKYSTTNHGYIYEMNYQKLKGWLDVYVEVDSVNENSDIVINELERKAWLVDKQIKTIQSMKVDSNELRETMNRERYYRQHPPTWSWKERELENRQKELNHINSVLSVHYKTENVKRFKVDTYSGRLHSIITRMGGDVRRNKLTIGGEKIVEIDVSSAQPSILGILLKEKYPDIQSKWLEHCLSGDFYEWVMEITGMVNYSPEQVSYEIRRNAYWDRSSKERLLSKIDENDPYVCFRPIVKNWILRFLFSAFKMSSTEKDGQTYYKHFLHNLCIYLKEKEPMLYDMLAWYRNNIKIIIKKKRSENGNVVFKNKKSSLLPRELQKQEVKYIKQCLSKLDDEVEYLYTVHDCIGCRQSDAERVKRIMEQTSVDMFGVKISLKIEG